VAEVGKQRVEVRNSEVEQEGSEGMVRQKQRRKVRVQRSTRRTAVRESTGTGCRLFFLSRRRASPIGTVAWKSRVAVRVRVAFEA